MKKTVLLILMMALCLGCIAGATACKKNDDEGKNEIPPHDHVIGEEWLIDKTNHWKACTVCKLVFEFGEHTANRWDATDTTHSKTCTVCKKTYISGEHVYLDGFCVCGMREPVPHTHASDVWRFDSKSHWKVCDECGESFDIANHSGICKCGVVATETKKLTFEPNEMGVSVTGVENFTESELVIPSYHDGLPVVRVGEGAFKDLAALAKVTFGANIAAFSKSAFEGCKELCEVVLPPTVTEVGEAAFKGCEKLTALETGENLQKIGASAFLGCKNLAAFSIPDCVTEIGASAFEGCEGLQELNIPAIERIESGTFRGCVNLYKADIPQTLKYVGENAFRGTQISSAVLPEGTEEVGARAFEGCKNLAEVTLPGTICSVGENAFQNTAYFNDKKNWTGNALYNGDVLLRVDSAAEGSFKIKAGTRVVSASAFLICVNITSVEFAKSVGYIGEGAFGGCNGITSLFLPDGLSEIGKSAFHDCEKLAKVSFGNSLREISMFAFSRCKSLEKVEFGASVAVIKEQAFLDCTALKRITFPASLEYIGKQAFFGSGLEWASFENSKRWGVSANTLSAATTVEVNDPVENARRLTDKLLFADSSWEKKE